MDREKIRSSPPKLRAKECERHAKGMPFYFTGMPARLKILKILRDVTQIGQLPNMSKTCRHACFGRSKYTTISYANQNLVIDLAGYIID
jgi:hypothetical protein